MPHCPETPKPSHQSDVEKKDRDCAVSTTTSATYITATPFTTMESRGTEASASTATINKDAAINKRHQGFPSAIMANKLLLDFNARWQARRLCALGAGLLLQFGVGSCLVNVPRWQFLKRLQLLRIGANLFLLPGRHDF